MATADGRIYITITDHAIEGEGGSGSSGNEGVKTTQKEKALGVIGHQALHFVLGEVKTAINYQVSHIGVRTGDYIAQQNVQVSVNLAYKGIGIGLSGLAGMKLGAKLGSMGGPIGAAIGAGVGTLVTATNMAHEWFDYARQVRLQNRDIALIRQRAGLDSFSDGSRGTEN